MSASLLTLSIRDLRDDAGDAKEEWVEELRAALPGVGESDPVDIRVWWALPSTTTGDAVDSLYVARPQPTARSVASAALLRAVERATTARTAATAYFDPEREESLGQAVIALHCLQVASNVKLAVCWCSDGLRRAAEVHYGLHDTKSAAKAARSAEYARQLADLINYAGGRL